MTQNPPRAPMHLQPPSKATSTSKSSAFSAAAGATPPISRASSEARKPRSPQNASQVDVTSDKATTAFVRRVLCTNAGHGTGPSDPHTTPRPIEQLLPPLTSSNEVDLQLYAIIAVVIKEFVYAWYAKITPDHYFVDEVVQIIAHCTRALEERLRRVDIEALVLDQLAGLVEAHVIAYKTAHESLDPQAFGSDPRTVYHVLNPHPALSPVPDPAQPQSVIEQSENESMYRQLLVQGALAVLLPTEDLENVCLRTLVGDIIADLILGNGVSGKACESWLIWEGLTKLVEEIKAQIEPETTAAEVEVDTRSRLEKYGLLSSTEEDESAHSPTAHQSQISALFWRVLQFGFLAFVALRFVIVGLARAPALASRIQAGAKSPPSSPMGTGATTPASALSWTSPPTIRPVVEFRVFALASQLLDVATRTPWLAGGLSFAQHSLVNGPGQLGETDGVLDKFLSHLIHAHLLSPRYLPLLLRAARQALFPNNQPSPPRDPPAPAPAEQIALRRTCAAEILSLVPPGIARVYFGRAPTEKNSAYRGKAKIDPEKVPSDRDSRGDKEYSDDRKVKGESPVPVSAEKEKKGEHVGDGDDQDREYWIRQIEDILDVFSDSYMNRHLLFSVVECILATLVPEMKERGPGELLGERLGY